MQGGGNPFDMKNLMESVKKAQAMVQQETQRVQQVSGPPGPGSRKPKIRHGQTGSWKAAVMEGSSVSKPPVCHAF